VWTTSLFPWSWFMLVSARRCYSTQYVKMIHTAYQNGEHRPVAGLLSRNGAAPDFHKLQFQPFIWLLLLTLRQWPFAAGQTGLTFVAVGLFGDYMALLSARNIALFAW